MKIINHVLSIESLFLSVFFFLFHITTWHFGGLFDEILDIFISILLFLGSISLHLLLLHLHLHLHSIGFLLLLGHVCKLLFVLLLLQGCLVFFLGHTLWDAVSFWGILDNMSVWTWLYFIIIWLVWLSVLWWRDSFSLALIVEFDTL